MKYKKMNTRKRGDKGQVTIFIILAIVILAVLLIIFYPRIKVAITPLAADDQVSQCIGDQLGNFMENIAEQGGSADAQNTISYQGRKIEYLCYTNEYYKTCVMQQPFLKQHVESEILNYIDSKAQDCVNQMATSFQNKGYDVSRKQGNISVELVFGALKIIANTPVTLTKGSTQAFDKFVYVKNSAMYDLIMTSESLLNYEARYGDSDTQTFMLYYPDIRIEKLKQDDGSKIYRLENRNTKEMFVFASRSLSWPAGYGISNPYVRV